MSKPISFALLICFMVVLASGNVLASGKPPLNAIRIAGEVLVGGTGGIAGLYSGFRIGEGISKSISRRIAGRDDIGLVNDIGGITGLVLGGTAGSAIGVYLVGSMGNQTGSFKATMLDAVTGLGVGLVAAAIHSAAPEAVDGGEIYVFAAQVIGANIGFNLTRRYESSSATKTAPIRIDLVKVRF